MSSWISLKSDIFLNQEILAGISLLIHFEYISWPYLYLLTPINCGASFDLLIGFHPLNLSCLFNMQIGSFRQPNLPKLFTISCLLLYNPLWFLSSAYPSTILICHRNWSSLRAPLISLGLLSFFISTRWDISLPMTWGILVPLSQ